MLIVVNPGHWNKKVVSGREVVDPGASGFVTEKDGTLAISQAVVARLQARGVDARLTPADHSLTLEGVVTWVNDLHAQQRIDLLISVHCDALDDPNANGCSAYYGEGRSAQAAVGRVLTAEVAQATGLRDKGAISDKLSFAGRLKIVQETAPLAILMECGFVSNEHDAAIIRDHADQIADGLVAGIARYLQRGPCVAPTDFPLTGPPTMSQAKFEQVLRDHNSPVTPLAAECWQIITAAGIDPTVALAFFGKESTLGTQGRAETLANMNWGNLRGDRAGGGGFQRFASWPAGLRAWCDHMRGPDYLGSNPPLDTICKIVGLYAPSNDGNDENQYILDLHRMISQWREGGQPGGVVVRDYPLAFVGRASITRSRFQNELESRHSPAAGAAFDLYNICVQAGVDPAVALAFFVLESNCGTEGGELLTNQNWGNMVASGDGVRGLQRFASWADSLRFWCQRLRTVYASMGKLTISQVVPTYQPYKAQLNGNQWYIQQLQSLIASWDAEAARTMAVIQ